MDRIVRIGGACAFIGDSVLGPRQLIQVPGMQYLVFDYLAEMTLSSFALERKTRPEGGYASDFVQVTLREILPTCMDKGIRLVANAGGLNPRACADAIAALARSLGCTPRIAWVEGDDCLALLPALRAEDVRDFYSGAPMPPQIDSANAYLGATPIARALALGADIVVTGRIVDSAATLGILLHEFGWAADALDQLAAGSLAGHILECGAQATGGIFTDWEQVPGWEHIGYPYIDCHADGTLIVRKPEGTGGLLNTATVSEQILYEVGDPGCYVLPDVVCDLREVRVAMEADGGVRVTGARGLPPPPAYKVSATWLDGYRCTVQVSVFGQDAIAKARRTADALLARVRRMLSDQGHADFSKVHVSVLGAEDSYGPHATQAPLREAVARIAVTHNSAAALDILSREARAAGVSFAPGTTSGSALTLNSRAAVEPRYRLFSFLLDKQRLPAARVHLDGQTHAAPLPAVRCATPVSTVPPAGPTAPASPGDASAALITLAHGRSGDKGDSSNIAIIARYADDLPLLRRELTPERVRAHLGHLVRGSVVRYEVPGLNALNFLLQEALDGGGPSSLRPDPMGKGMAQQLLGMVVGTGR